MKRLAMLAFLLVGCGDIQSDEVESADGITIVVKPKLQLSCEILEDGYSCHCEASECGLSTLIAIGNECNRLRAELK